MASVIMSATPKANLRIAIFSILSLIAFAANSLLCRIALGQNLIDASGFTSIRLMSAAFTLWLLCTFLRKNTTPKSGNWLSGVFLSLYAVTFSLAYLGLSTGTGAIILFGAVQITMIGYGMWAGERPRLLEYAGLVTALGGLIYLVFPGITAPSPENAALMAIAGISWGIYSLRGRRGSYDPVVNTAVNFVCSVPFALAIALIGYGNINLSPKGVLLAVISGAITSGLGYVIWYTALKGLTATRAAEIQLSVPLLAAFGGIVFLGENLSLRLLVAASLILGGVALTLISKQKSSVLKELKSS